MYIVNLTNLFVEALSQQCRVHVTALISDPQTRARNNIVYKKIIAWFILRRAYMAANPEVVSLNPR